MQDESKYAQSFLFKFISKELTQSTTSFVDHRVS